MKNTTVSRRPGNDMVKNAGYQPAVRKSNQSGDGESFAFNGQMGDGVNRAGRQSVSDNRYSLGAKSDSINMGLRQSQRKGNASSSPKDIGPSATRDKREMTMATASAGVNIGSGFHCPPVGNPDKIYIGR